MHFYCLKGNAFESNANYLKEVRLFVQFELNFIHILFI